MKFLIPSSEDPDSPSQRKELGRSKISSAETEIFHQKPLRAFQCIPMTLSSTQEAKTFFSAIEWETTRGTQMLKPTETQDLSLMKA